MSGVAASSAADHGDGNPAGAAIYVGSTLADNGPGCDGTGPFVILAAQGRPGSRSEALLALLLCAQALTALGWLGLALVVGGVALGYSRVTEPTR